MSNDATIFSNINKRRSDILLAKSNEPMKAEEKIKEEISDLTYLLYVLDLSANLLSVCDEKWGSGIVHQGQSHNVKRK